MIGGKVTGHYRYKTGFYGLADMPVIFQEKIDRVLEMKTPAWQDDILVVTRGSANDHFKDVNEILERLEKAGYRASSEKTELFRKEINWLGYHISADGIKPKQQKTDAILAFKPPTKIKEVRSFLGSVQYLSKFIPRLADLTKPLRKLTEKTVTRWNWTEVEQNAFDRIKTEITDIKNLAHYDTEKETILSVDASTVGLGATLWQVDHNGQRKPVSYHSRKLNKAETKYAINELEMLAIVNGF